MFTAKHLFFTSFFSFFVSIAFGQETTPTDSTIFPIEALTVKPAYEGGSTAMYRFLGQNIKFPMSARQRVGNIGTAYINFVIDEKGKIDASSVKLLFFLTGVTKKEPNPKRIFLESKLDGVQKDCVQEAKRVVLLLTLWSAGQADGKAVKCYHSLPITFKNEGVIIQR